MVKNFRNYMTVALVACLFAGCSDGKDEIAATKPRPVEVATLSMSLPPDSSLVTASVASWKNEPIGMEVGGRILYVLEPNQDIEGRVVAKDGTVIVEGTVLAEIDDERYRLQVENAKAQIERTQKSIEAANSELEDSIPAQIRAAEAEKKLALTEFERSKSLFEKKAGAQADVDRDEAKYQSAIAAIDQLNSLEDAKRSEIAALEFQLAQNEKALRDAEKDVEACKLYSSFSGQISEVNVVQGSVVSTGQSIATVQMMDPIKIELEVSSEESRRLRNRQRIPVIIKKPDGLPEEKDGFLYLVDAVADPQTRTFTVTLLVLNERLDDQVEDDGSSAMTDQMWRMDFEFLPGAEEGRNYVSEDAILNDEKGPYVWRVNNVEVSDGAPKDRKLKVSKMRVKPGNSRLPFLGNWIFQEVEILDETFDRNKNLVAGKLVVEQGEPNEWDGDTVIIQRMSQWMLRPGDVVKVDLSENDSGKGIYVPMDSIAYKTGKTYLMLIEENGSEKKVEQVEVRIVNAAEGRATSSRLKVEPVDGGTQFLGRQYVSRGVHYLRDGEPVNVIDAGDRQ